MGVTPAVVIGFLLGFGFGVGCALAVMYSIYMGGYKKAVGEAEPPTERFLQVRAKLEK
jgi:hypothetical protein